jgi:hypothetical protein
MFRQSPQGKDEPESRLAIIIDRQLTHAESKFLCRRSLPQWRGLTNSLAGDPDLWNDAFQ